MDERIALDYDDPEQAKLLIIDITVGTFCNYACAYCPPALHDNSSGFLPYEDVVRFTEAVRRHWPHRLCYRITGGEPTTYAHLPAMLAHNRRLGIANSLISNGSRSPRWWDQISDRLDLLFLSYHPERAKLAHFAALMQTIAGRIPVFLEVMAPPEHFAQSHDAYHFLASQNYPRTRLLLKKMRINFGDSFYPYSDEQLAIFANQSVEPSPDFDDTYRPMHFRLNDGRTVPLAWLTREPDWLNFAGWQCDAGLVNLVVTQTGELYRAQCRVGGSFGHISDKTYTFPNTPIICTKSACLCTTDLQIRKSRE